MKKASPPHSKRQSPREERVKNRLVARHQDKRLAAGQLSKDLGSQIEAALKQLSGLGYHMEVNAYFRLLASRKTIRTRKKEVLYRREVHYKGHSLCAFLQYITQGESAAFSELPVLFFLDYSFFSSEPWIQHLLAEWLRRGETEKVTRALYGGASNERRYKQALYHLQRNEKIVDAVEKLLKKGCGYNEAMSQVAGALQSLDITEHLSSNAVQKIYHERTKGIPSFFKYLLSL